MERVPEIVTTVAISRLENLISRASDRLGQDISVGEGEGVRIEDLVVTPNKPNFARTQAEVRVAGRHALDMWIIAFRPGDSTGDSSETYPPGSLILPEHIKPTRGEEALYPRPKKEVAEICLPLASSDSDGRFVEGTELRLLSVSERVKGRSVIDYAQSQVLDSTNSSAGKKVGPFITLGTDNFGRRVGDPHSLLYPSTLNGENAIDVVGFLPAITERSEGGVDLLDLLASFEPINPYTS